MPRLEEIYQEMTLEPEDAKAVFTDIMANYWGGALFNQAAGNEEGTNSAKKSFYEGLDKMLQYKYAKGGNINKKGLEKLNVFRDMNWMQSEVIEQVSACVREMLGRNG